MTDTLPSPQGFLWMRRARVPVWSGMSRGVCKEPCPLSLPPCLRPVLFHCLNLLGPSLGVPEKNKGDLGIAPAVFHTQAAQEPPSLGMLGDPLVPQKEPGVRVKVTDKMTTGAGNSHRPLIGHQSYPSFRAVGLPITRATPHKY